MLPTRSPWPDFFDLFYIGEGETSYFALLDAFKASKAAGESRVQFLERAAEIPGIYVPSFYDVTYNETEPLRPWSPTIPMRP